MFFPLPLDLQDHRTGQTVPVANRVLIVLNVLAFLLLTSGNWMVGPSSGPLSILTYGFVHSGFLHLLLNMWVLEVFGSAVNRRLGNWLYTLSYLGIIVAVGLVARLSAGSYLLGSSGGVYGVMAMAFLLMPAARVEVGYLVLFPLTLLAGLLRPPRLWLFWFLRWGTVRVTLYLCLLVVPAMSLVGLLTPVPIYGWDWTQLAHLLGFLAGIGATLLLPARVALRQPAY